ncbi:hypothetical protein AB0P16_17840 [Dietzia maris]|uniref:hypothetical protein n=1 Tax=Dietzia maris TaxID=37915 RepID=UPI00341B10AB
MLLSEIEELRDSIARLDRQREELKWRRDQLVLQTLQEKVPVAEIVAASGVNRARIYQIRAEHKQGTQEGTS